jgi:eukaryotic-like serine/threonine-protein kinase
MNDDLLAAAANLTPVGRISLTESLPDEFAVVGVDYALIERIGLGGMGEVWRARQLSTGRDVALKLLRHEVLDTRFQLEVSALGRLEHPGIVRLLQAGQHDGQPFLAMELVPGSTLAEQMRRGPLAYRQAARWVEEAALAVAHAHERGLVHRDLKPSNLLVDTQGRVRVTDFGVVKDLSTASDLTRTGNQVGTPSYMAPEQVDTRLGESSPATDVYGLGASLYHALAGRQPFTGHHPEAIFHRILSDEPTPVRQLNAEVPRDLEVICLKALAKEPSRRYANATDFAADLARWRRGEPIQARPLVPAERVWRWMRRPWGNAGFLALMGGVLVWATFVSRRERDRLDTALRDWPLREPAPIRELKLPGSGAGRAASFSPDGAWFAVGGNDRSVRIASIDPWRVLTNDLSHPAYICLNAWQPGSRRLLTADTEGLTRLWPITPVGEPIDGRLAGMILDIDFSADGTRWAAGSAAGEVCVWKEEGSRSVTVFSPHFPGAVVTVKFSYTGHLLTSLADGRLQIWDPATGVLVRGWSGPGSITTAAFSPDDSLVAFAAYQSNRDQSLLNVNRVNDGTIATSVLVDGRITRVRFSPDGGRLGVSIARRTAQLWDLSGQLISQSAAHDETVVDVLFSADGLRLLSVDQSARAWLWDAHSVAPLSLPWRGKSGIVRAVFAPSGLQVGSGDGGPSGTLWDTTCPLALRMGAARTSRGARSRRAIGVSTPCRLASPHQFCRPKPTCRRNRCLRPGTATSERSYLPAPARPSIPSRIPASGLELTVIEQAVSP